MTIRRAMEFSVLFFSLLFSTEGGDGTNRAECLFCDRPGLGVGDQFTLNQGSNEL